VKIRRRMCPDGVESPRVAKLRVLDEEHRRRNTCVTWRNDEGYDQSYHEPKEESDERMFVWDPKLRRRVSSVECVHCGRKGVLIILELGDHWDDLSVEREEDKSVMNGRGRLK
jgi:hypothetical protein